MTVIKFSDGASINLTLKGASEVFILNNTNINNSIHIEKSELTVYIYYTQDKSQRP